MSRRQPQRRRAGQNHVDPLSAATAEALLHPDRLEEHLSSVLGAAQAQIPDSTSDEEESVQSKQDEKICDAMKRNALEAQSIFAAGGDAEVQERLKSEIAVTKKLESEIAQIKKKVEAARRQHDSQLAEYNKAVAQKDSLHETCKALLTERDRLEKFHKEQAEADEVRRQEVKSKFEKDVDAILAKVREQAKQKEEVLQENVTLQAEFDALKAQFDGMMESKMTEWQAREASTKELVSDLTTKITEHEKLQSECQRLETEARELVENIAAYSEQITTYASRLGDFESALAKSSEVVKLTVMQREQLDHRIAQLEEAKKMDVAAKKQLDDETLKSRNRIRDLKKQITQLERTKDSAEKKCRALQDAMRKLNAQKNPPPAAPTTPAA